MSQTTMTKTKLPAPKYMMATKAFHQLGEISNKEPDLCVVSEEDADHYIGNWVYGLGFVNVKFPKWSTFDLTKEEVTKYNGQRLVMSSLATGKPSYEMAPIKIAGAPVIKVLDDKGVRQGGVTSSMSWHSLADAIANMWPSCPVRDGERIVQFEVDETGIRFIMEKP